MLIPCPFPVSPTFRLVPPVSDEFMVPYASVAIGRTLWVVFLVVTLIVSGSYMFDAQCTDAGYAAFFYEVVSITVGVISIIVEFRIAVVSTYGTIIGM